jgi:hypothetical protein
VTKKVRVVGWQVQPLLMLDDGEHLTALNAQPVTIPAAEWEKWKDGGDEQFLAPARLQFEED